MRLYIIYKSGEQKALMLEEGSCFHVTPGLVHQFEGHAEETHIIEFSTQHFETDSYRTQRGD